MNDQKIEIKVGNDIPYDQLLRLFESVEWIAYTRGKRRSELGWAIQNSTYVVSAWCDDMLIGLARGLSDESSIFFLQDILVKPDFQRMGIGKQLLENCLERFNHVRNRVLLTGDAEAQKYFYESLGFKNIKDLSKFKLNTFVLFDGME